MIPDKALDSHIGILGKTGSGKSYTARGLVERLLDAGRQVVIVDPTGAWSGIRAGADGGPHGGFPIPIFGGLHGDVPLQDSAGAAVADVIVQQQTSAVLDLSLLSGAAQRRLMTAFVGRLRQKPRGALWLVVDEADEFMPQVLPPDMTNLFGDLKWIVRRGRLSGFRVVMITQRPAEIAKAMLTQIETLVAHRLTAPQDRKAIEEWVKGHSDGETAREVLTTLASLDRGQAWLWAPDLSLLERMVSPQIRTFDSGRTPDAGETVVAQPTLAELDLGAIRQALATDYETNASSAKGKSAPSASAHESETLIQTRKQLDTANEETARWRRIAEHHARALDALRQQIGAALAAFPSVPAEGGGGPAGDQGQTEGRQVMMSAAPRAKPQRQRQDKPREVTAGETALNPTAQAIRDLLERMNPARVSWAQAAAMVGRKPSGGNFNAARKQLRESGLIAEEGDLIRSASERAFGMDFNEAVDLWKSVLPKPAPAMLDALLKDERPGMSKDELGAAIRSAPRGGYFNGGLAALRNNGVVIDRGGLISLASPIPGESA